MFAAIASGNPLQLSEEVPNSNGLQHTLVLSSTKPKNYSHITLFILPNVTFPEQYIATIYFKLDVQEDFKLFGYLSNEKPSAIFKVKLSSSSSSSNSGNDNTQNSPYGDSLGEIDMDDENMDTNVTSSLSQLIIGISIEPRLEGLQKLQNWKDQMTQMNKANSQSLVIIRNNSNILTAGQLARRYPNITQELAGKIVQHAYNYLSGFLDSNGNVSIKIFDNWWDKFKKRLSNDATFLDEVTK